MAKKKKKEEEVIEQEEQAEGKKKGGLLKWIILLVLLIALGAGGFFGYKYFFASDGSNATETAEDQSAGGQEEHADKQEDAEKPEQQGPTEIYSLPPFVVNLADPLGRRYLKVAIDVEVVSKKVADEMDKNLPRVKDTLLLLLSSKTFSDLDSMEEKITLKNEIVQRLNQILGKGKVVNVYFTEFVAQ